MASDGVDNVEMVSSVVHGIIEGLPIPFPLPNPDGCKDNGLECPLKKDKTYSFLTTLPVLKSYPKVNIFNNILISVIGYLFGFFFFLLVFFLQMTLEVKWQLQNEKGDNIVCVLIPAKIE